MRNSPNRRRFKDTPPTEMMVIDSTDWPAPKSATICALISDLRVATNVLSADPNGRGDGIVTPSEAGSTV